MTISLIQKYIDKFCIRDTLNAWLSYQQIVRSKNRLYYFFFFCIYLFNKNEANVHFDHNQLMLLFFHFYSALCTESIQNLKNIQRRFRRLRKLGNLDITISEQVRIKCTCTFTFLIYL